MDGKEIAVMCFNQFVHRINCGTNMQNVRGMPQGKLGILKSLLRPYPGPKLKRVRRKTL